MATTDDRDKELDSLDEELGDERGDRFIHKPDEIKAGDGSMCFLDVERMCGADCTAFNWEMDTSRRQAPNQCTILYHLGAMSSASINFIRSSKAKRQATEDEQRQTAARGEVPSV